MLRTETLDVAGAGPQKPPLPRLAARGSFFPRFARCWVGLWMAFIRASLRQPLCASIWHRVDNASDLSSLASTAGFKGGTMTTPPVAASLSTSSRILASCSRLALARLRNSRLLQWFSFLLPSLGHTGCAFCSRLKPSANGSTIACAARSSAAVLAFFNRSIATSSCSVPLAFRAMTASTKGKGYIITVSICNWNNYN